MKNTFVLFFWKKKKKMSNCCHACKLEHDDDYQKCIAEDDTKSTRQPRFRSLDLKKGHMSYDECKQSYKKFRMRELYLLELSKAIEPVVKRILSSPELLHQQGDPEKKIKYDLIEESIRTLLLDTCDDEPARHNSK